MKGKTKTGFVARIAQVKHPTKGNMYYTTYNPSNQAVAGELSRTNSIFAEMEMAKKHKLQFNILDTTVFISTCRKEFINTDYLISMQNTLGMNGSFDIFLEQYKKYLNDEINRLMSEPEKNKQQLADLKLLLK